MTGVGVVGLTGPLTGPVDDAGLASAYAWPAGRWTRAMMLYTLDGAVAGADGHSRSLSSELDRRVLGLVRRGADAVLVGAGTFRAERYRPLHLAPEIEAGRIAAGRRPRPRLVLVTARGDLPWDEAALRRPDDPALLLTTRATAAGLAERARDAGAAVEVDVAGEDAVQPSAVLARLHARGLERVVCEGGPTLLTALTRAGLVDEACVSLAPVLAGGGQVAAGPAALSPARHELAQLLRGDDGFLFGRWVRSTTSGDAA